jgi:adenosylmethionine-8-amino-7-oxononanoate aminotransferase
MRLTKQKYALPADADELIWHPFTPYGNASPLNVVRAKGAKLYLDDGRAIIDAISSWWVNLHGHGRKEIVNAIRNQAHRMEHVIFAGFTHRPAKELAHKLINAFEPGVYTKVFYSDNGSTAVEIAAKMALQAHYNAGKKRNLIVALEGAYHGDTFGAMAMGERSAFNEPFKHHLFEVVFIKPPYVNNPLSEEHDIDFSASLAQLSQLVHSGRVAAFIFEPLVQGATGMQMYHYKWLEEAIAICKPHHVYTIADEVMTGFGRTGKLFATQYLQNSPDIICLSKGITGGFLPLGATICSESVFMHFRDTQILKTFFHGHSYTANPIACAAANASFDLLLQRSTQKHIRRIHQRHLAFMHTIRHLPLVKNIRCLGTILAIELHTNTQTSYINEARHFLYQYFLNKNILLRPLGNVVYILPPYIIQDRDLNHIYHVISNLLLKGELPLK